MVQWVHMCVCPSVRLLNPVLLWFVQQRLQLKRRGEFTEKLDLEELLTQVCAGGSHAPQSTDGQCLLCGLRTRSWRCATWTDRS